VSPHCATAALRRCINAYVVLCNDLDLVYNVLAMPIRAVVCFVDYVIIPLMTLCVDGLLTLLAILAMVRRFCVYCALGPRAIYCYLFNGPQPETATATTDVEPPTTPTPTPTPLPTDGFKSARPRPPMSLDERRKNRTRGRKIRRAQAARRLNARLRGTSWKRKGSGACTYKEDDGWWLRSWLSTPLDDGTAGSGVRQRCRGKIFARAQKNESGRRVGRKDRRNNGKADCTDNFNNPTSAGDDVHDTRLPATGKEGHRSPQCLYGACCLGWLEWSAGIYWPFRH
jgi:hypothetical protein